MYPDNQTGTLDWARLSRVTVVRPQPDGTFVTDRVDLRRFLEKGDPLANPKLKAGDTVNVARQNHLVYELKTRSGAIIGAMTALITLGLLVNELQKEN